MNQNAITSLHENEYVKVLCSDAIFSRLGANPVLTHILDIIQYQRATGLKYVHIGQLSKYCWHNPAISRMLLHIYVFK